MFNVGSITLKEIAMRLKRKSLALVIVLTLPNTAFGKCDEWDDGKEMMKIDASLLPEASGLIVSQKHKNTYYQVNDSGDGPYFYASNAESGVTTKIKIESYTPTDVEDFGYGSCGKAVCIVLADIGDNKTVRRSVSLVVIEEPDTMTLSLKPSHIVRARYPDGPHNAEGLAVHPNGDIFVVTKEKTKKNEPLKARLYRLGTKEWQQKGDREGLFSFVGEITLSSAKLGKKAAAKKITSMDIHPSGDRFILLTYEAAIEFELDLSKLKSGSAINDSYTILEIPNMPQQESVAYSPSGKGFYYTSEVNRKKVEKAQKKGKRMREAALISIECKQAKT